MTLIERCLTMIDTLGIKKTEFCKNVRIGYSTFFKWSNNELTISIEMIQKIDNYLKSYNF